MFLEILDTLWTDICVAYLLLFSIMAHKHINDLIAEVEMLKSKLEGKEKGNE